MTIRKKLPLFLFPAVCLIAIALLTASCAVEGGNTPQSSEAAADLSMFGTPEWNAMSREERLAAVQAAGGIPDGLPTRRLLELVFDDLLMSEIFYFSSYEEGFQHVYSHSQFLQALVARKDLGRVFLDYYREIPVITDRDSEDLLDCLRLLSTTEATAAQPSFTQNFSEAEMAELYRLVEEKYFEKKAASDIYGTSASLYYQAASLPLPEEP